MDIPTPQELATRLGAVNAKQIAALSGLSQKTIYRYRWMQFFPTGQSLLRLLPALRKLEKERRP